jgi:hypothetical protein
MKKGIALALTLASSLSFADPNIFGMELGKMTERELKGKYNVTSTGTNKYSNGNMYSVPTNSIDFSGLKKVSTVFDKKGTLVAVLTTLPKSKFDYLNNALGGKYKKVSENIPFVGNKTATYRDGGTEITLDAPHMSFDMSMNYVTDDFMKTYQRQSQAESRQKAQNEASQL